MVVRVPKSWTPPHQVTFQKAFRFYARDTNGKYQVDVDGLRAAFVSSGAIGDQLRSFRADRMAKLLSGDAPVPLQDGAKLVLHVARFSAMGAGEAFPLAAAETDDRLFPTWSNTGGRNVAVTFEGLVASSSSDPPPARQRAYTSVSRTGTVEAVSTLHEYEALPTLLAQIIDHALKYARSLDRLGVRPPFAIASSAAVVRLWCMTSSQAALWWWICRPGPFPSTNTRPSRPCGKLCRKTPRMPRNACAALSIIWPMPPASPGHLILTVKVGAN